MWNKKRKLARLSAEILGLLGVTAAIAMFFYGFLRITADSIVLTYQEAKDIYPTEMQEIAMDTWIQSLSLLSAVILFIVLFLFLLGQKLAYLRVIIQGVEALHTHRMDFTLPLDGENELTELARSINYLAEAERQLQQKEAELQEEREAFIRSLSHDIRTPLTAMLSYSEYMQQKSAPTQKEQEEYIDLMKKKAEQIKALTDQLLDGTRRKPESIEDGKLLMEQLVEEWLETLEDDFNCVVHLDDCPAFSAEADIQELQRIFDNLASNIEKYADPEQAVTLKVSVAGEHLLIEQTNIRKMTVSEDIKSHGIGLESIRRIAKNYGGDVEALSTEQTFAIRITLFSI